MGYCKTPEQSQSITRPICHSHTMTSMGRKLATIRIAAQELTMLHNAPEERGRREMGGKEGLWVGGVGGGCGMWGGGRSGCSI